MSGSPRLVLPRLKVRPVALALAVIALLSVFAFNIRAQQLSIPGLRAPEKIPSAKKELLAKDSAAHGEAPLNRLYDHVRVEQSKIRRLPALDPRVISEEKPEKKRRVGVVRVFSRPVRVSSDSALYNIAEGDVRVIGLASEGATYTRVHFTGFSLPAGAKVFVYSVKNPEEFYGPYEGRGPAGDGSFWTPPMEGDAVAIEYFTPAGVADSTSNPFQVSEISHVYRSLFTSPDNLTAGSCNLDVTSEWSEVAKSVGHLQFISGGGEYACTGTLLNNSSNDQTPYLLTANHCFSTNSEAQSLRVYWFYNTGDSPPAGTPRTDGANLLSTGTASDFTLVRLTGALPGGLFFSGWDATATALSSSVTGIHHPEGSHKRISFGSTVSECEAGLPGSCQNYTNVRWNSGTTEPGSSGSGIWAGDSASDPRLVGTLTGGYSSCSNPSGTDYYGSFSVTYQSISGFLNPPPVCVTAINPTSQHFPGNGGRSSISVSAPAGCEWTASSSHGFVNIVSGWNGIGNMTVTFVVEPNPFSADGTPGAPRTATITIGRQVFTVTQSAGSISSNCTTTPISFGQTINGALATTDCQRGNGSYSDAYSFQGTAGQQISISMLASINAYLILISPNGSVLATDDNGGGGTNSRIPAGGGLITLPSTGTYTILASSFTPFVVGAYMLSVNDSTVPTVPQTPGASISDASIIEGNSETSLARFNISLSAPTTKLVCVQAITADGTAIAGTDYFALGGSNGALLGPPPPMIFFEPGVTTATVTVQVRGDTLIEPDETFLVNLHPCSTDVTIAKGQAVGTIINDDLLPMKLVLEESGPGPNQAAAMDSMLFIRDQFTVVNAANLLNQWADNNTRIIVFVTNLVLNQNEAASSVIVNLTGSNNQSYDIPAEDVRLVPLFNFTQVRFRLPNNLAPGTATIRVKAHGQESNSATIRIKG